jgi:hypothetical protein
VPDPATLTAIFAGVIGLVPDEPAAAATATWHNDDKAHGVTIRPGPARDATLIGFEAVDAAAFDWVAGRLHVAGYDLTVAGDADVGARHAGRMAHGVALGSLPCRRWPCVTTSPRAGSSSGVEGRGRP